VVVRLVIGLLVTVAALAIAGRRGWWLYKLVHSGQPAPGRADHLGERLGTQFREVIGQRKLLKWSVPGLAHAFTFWGFLILGFTIVETWGALFEQDFAFWWFGHARWLGFLEDFFAVAILVALVVFAILRYRQAPERRHRASRFYGSHTRAAWVVLGMISAVLVTLLIYRGAQVNTGVFPYGQSRWPFASHLISLALRPLGVDANEIIETTFILLNIAVICAFLVIVAYSKHLHIALAPINVAAKRLPKGLGPLLAMESEGKPIDFEDPGEDDTFGRGKVEDFTWKGMLDFATCTECGRCQSQCPAWNTGKPLSPKLVIMDLRDHLFAKAPYIIGGKDMPEEGAIDFSAGFRDDSVHSVPESGFERVRGSGPEQAARPLVGTLEQGGVIDPDVLWSCTTCGACVEQCPVDIEHVDHIVDMRRHQVLIESEFPSELGVLFKNLENKGNPWGQNAKERLDWTKKLDFEVQVFDGELAPEVEYLFWIGCAGAFDDGAKKTVQATAELLHRAGVNYTVLGPEETCTGDPARRSGNEFLFQMLAQQNVEVLNTVFEGREPGTRKIVTTCPHCLNTLGREYPQLDGHYEVVHHTQLLNKLVREGKLVPVAAPAGDGINGTPAPVTYHDPCYLGRHNEVYEEPRSLVGAAGATLTEMPRHADRSMCCGAGGARMWMEERIGQRVNVNRTEEAISTISGAAGGDGSAAGTIAVGCPFCKTMITDGLTQKQSEGDGENVQVQDVSQMLLAAVRRGDPAVNGSSNGSGPAAEEPVEPAEQEDATS
jgi:Fe-S oxidoreductase